MHSFFGGFSEEEIAAVKAACPKKRYLYDAVKAYAEDRQGMSDGGPEAEQSEAEAAEAEPSEAEQSEAEDEQHFRIGASPAAARLRQDIGQISVFTDDRLQQFMR